MNMDAGGLVHMTYNDFTSNGGLGAPGTGYSSRGKGSHIKHLSMGPQAYGNQSYGEQLDVAPTPRTSRSHLLAGLRTAPKSAPLSQYGAPSNRYSYHGDSGYGNQYSLGYGQEMPQSAMGSNFGGRGNNKANNRHSQMYSMPEHVLAPPALDFSGPDGELIDPQAYGDLMATNAWLVKRQQQLQQQLVDVTAAAQQFQGMSLNNGQQYHQGAQVAPQSSLYNQQAQNGMQPQIQAVPNQPGVYSVYNPMTGQYSCFVDQNMQQQSHLQSSPPLTNPGISSSPSEDDGFSQLRNETRSPVGYSAGQSRNVTPPKHTPSPSQSHDVAPLPPPSANAFRPAHKKTVSLAGSSTFGKLNGGDGSRLGAARTSGIPNTPLSGTFGPGMGRAGEHPTRQPRGPPPLEELVAAPTSTSEGSKNFATRQRRRAIFNLVRAGNERRVGNVRTTSGESF